LVFPKTNKTDKKRKKTAQVMKARAEKEIQQIPHPLQKL
jgi:hypothetical protein